MPLCPSKDSIISLIPQTGIIDEKLVRMYNGGKKDLFRCFKSSNDLAKVSIKKRQYGQRIKLTAITSEKDTSEGDHMPCFVSLGGLDPFQILPIHPSPEVQLLVDHYTRVIPTLVPMACRTDSQQHQPAVDLFRLYCLHPASFLGMLYHSARHRESLHDDCTGESLSLTFKLKTIREVNSQIGNGKLQGRYPDNGTIMAIYLLSAAERMWGDVNIFRMHWRAMYDIIDAKGGADAFTDDNLMYAKAVWNCFALLNARDGYFNCPQITHTAGGNYDFRIPSDSMVRNCHSFVQSYTRRKTSILRLLPNTEAEARLQGELYPRRISAFQTGRVLHQILEPPYTGGTTEQSHTFIPQPASNNRSVQIQGDRCRTDNCRLACIIYINLVLMELGDLSKHTELFLLSLEQLFTRNPQILSPEYLLWVLLRTPGPLASKTAQDLWAQAIQIIAVVKRASFHNVMHYQEAMFLFLQLVEDASKLAPALQLDLTTIQEEALRDNLDKPSDSLDLGYSDVSPSHEHMTSRVYCELLWFQGGL
ncbi:uncharacterized protein ACLA_033160 [Aspergillus clavatus NRRL 1]|uniref:Uncharacterized protein n=1 Tax=Aspergillus clavatus (strain ATCC 1007 / CBS 513.65 / DSM 816 / NCTC 3887 / NRRL 1 / QM 1276 / 107) TaxID=344612 RepID=A1CSF9_ASPCL|nr:uncharacterized protein ACLA_033160 [Aspergillus clavatus NRRL 1]EAW08580.1 hypothetical protein ACLA_033160 [Aspergillus clavatus NRRL 1]